MVCDVFLKKETRIVENCRRKKGKKEIKAVARALVGAAGNFSYKYQARHILPLLSSAGQRLESFPRFRRLFSHFHLNKIHFMIRWVVWHQPTHWRVLLKAKIVKMTASFQKKQFLLTECS